MAASEAQIRANRRNSEKSTGPRTPEGKEKSRANSYKHGLTGSGIVVLEAEAAEIRRRHVALCEELNPADELGMTLVLRAAILAVRMERCVDQEHAAIADHIRRLEREFVPPEGVEDAEADQLRAEAGRRALFDASKETTLVRKYEAAAERGFFRVLRELRQRDRAIKAANEAWVDEKLASILPGDLTDEEFDALCVEDSSSTAKGQVARPGSIDFSTLGGRFDVPFTIGKPG